MRQLFLLTLMDIFKKLQVNQYKENDYKILFLWNFVNFLCQCFHLQSISLFRTMVISLNLQQGTKSKVFYKKIPKIRDKILYYREAFLGSIELFWSEAFFTLWGSLREKCPYLEIVWSVFSCIQSEYGKIRTRKTLNTDNFHEVWVG